MRAESQARHSARRDKEKVAKAVEAERKRLLREMGCVVCGKEMGASSPIRFHHAIQDRAMCIACKNWIDDSGVAHRVRIEKARNTLQSLIEKEDVRIAFIREVAKTMEAA